MAVQTSPTDESCQVIADVLQIDGSFGEGGGQLLRSAVALSAITASAVRIANIRARRDKPGMAPQHLAAVRAVAQLCGAHTEGAELRSQALSFEPGAIRSGAYDFDIGTAGSVTLLAQALLPVLLSAPGPSMVSLRGGTDVRGAPPLDYLVHVLLPLLRRMGCDIQIGVRRRGYYPRGGGEIMLAVSPTPLRPLVLESPGALVTLRGRSHVANLPLNIPERMRTAAIAALGGLSEHAHIDAQVLGPDEAMGTGGAIVLWAQTARSSLGAGRVAQRGTRAEALGESAGAELKSALDCGAALDMHAADQILVYTALAGGTSRFTTSRLSSHAMTAMWLIEQFAAARFTTDAMDPRVAITAAPSGRVPT